MTLADCPDGAVVDVTWRGEPRRVWLSGKHKKIVFGRVQVNGAWTGHLTLDPTIEVTRVVAQSLRLLEET